MWRRRESGVALGIKAYIVYSKSAGDNWDLDQAVMLTPVSPQMFLLQVSGCTKHIL